MWDWLFSSPDPNTTQTLLLQSQWGGWVEALVLSTCVLIFGLTVWNYRHTRRLSHKVGLLSLRAAILLLLLFLFYQPTLVEETIQRSRNTVVILVDNSASMQLPHERGSRMEEAIRFLERNEAAFKKWEETNDLLFYRFSEGLTPMSGAADTDSLNGEGQMTAILENIEGAEKQLGTRQLGGMVLVSDGVDTGELATRMMNMVGLDGDTRETIAALQAPIYAFSFEGPDAVKDVSLHRLRYNNFAFHLNVSTLDALIRITGYPPGTNVLVTLFEDGQLLTTSTITTAKNQRDYEIAFDFVPKRLGSHVYTVTAQDLPGDIYKGNNEKNAIVRVIRDRIRVLQICGHPSWDERFIRNFLKRDPEVDLISFFILINPQNVFAVPQGETSLIPFPAHELFVEELGGFDLVIFQDFNYGPFQTRQHLWRVRDFVKEGGAFLMIGGARTFSEGGYEGTELTEILPVDIGRSNQEGESLSTARFRPLLTDAGRAHPITRLEPDPFVNEERWRNMPELEGLNKVTGLKEEAVSLLDHPSLRTARGVPMPLVAVGEVGKGRVMSLMTDTSWLWSFHSSAAGGTSAPYNAFWTNAIRWLIQDPELDLVRVHLEATEVGLHEEITLKASVLGPDYLPLNEHSVDIRVYRRTGRGLVEDRTLILDARNQTTNERGFVTLPYTPEEVGVYDVEATARIHDRTATGNQVFIAIDRRPEYQVIVAEQDVLGLIADESGGESYALSQAIPELSFREPDLLRIVAREEEPLWAKAELLILACLLFGAEWWFRRKLGYL